MFTFRKIHLFFEGWRKVISKKIRRKYLTKPPNRLREEWLTNQAQAYEVEHQISSLEFIVQKALQVSTKSTNPINSDNFNIFYLEYRNSESENEECNRENNKVNSKSSVRKAVSR